MKVPKVLICATEVRRGRSSPSERVDFVSTPQFFRPYPHHLGPVRGIVRLSSSPAPRASQRHSDRQGDLVETRGQQRPANGRLDLAHLTELFGAQVRVVA